ncbi:methylated-DNA--[protein]-cysteine S-methyltransferase [Selenomonas sp. TAMA-11512]|uniref:methylated-DNA--[protein]-cysteine S-methyltransferase n=1 Tax=Selenomonas sp. TAMA-11512 TaxID=3095337 RepID=UPI00308B5D6B|nr:methylated-DNA--[protein]-cysteine S-methyltransferase [Selenomonas sp. TAMA-11512]
MQYTAHYTSPLGPITLAADGTALTGLWFDGQKYFADTLDETHEKKSLPIFEEVRRWLDLYFSGKEPDFLPPLAPKATPFQKSVWDVLLSIPYGRTMTYGEIAARIGRKKASHAVGGAVSRNPVSLIIPCHRVVGASGSLTGYAGGIDKKIRLLELEGVDMARLFVL